MCGGEREFSVTFEDSQWVPVCMGLAKPLAWPLGDSAARLSGGPPGRGTGATDPGSAPSDVAERWISTVRGGAEGAQSHQHRLTL